MESQNLLSESRVGRRFQKCLHASEFNVMGFRGIATGTVITSIVADVVFSIQLRESIKYGQLPWYSLDVLIVAMGVLEAIMAVFWAWFGKWKLRTLTFVCLLLAGSGLILWTLPSIPFVSGSEFCTSTATSSVSYTGMSTAGAVRLALFIFTAVSHAIARSAAWSYCLVILDQADPGKLSLHYGALIGVRILPLLVFPKLIDLNSPMWLNFLSMFLPGIIHGFQFYRLPEPISKEGFAEESNARIWSSGLVLGQILAIGFLVAPFWGYLSHSLDIFKVSFYVLEPPGINTNQLDILYCYVIILAIAVYGIYYTRDAVFNKVSAMKLAAFTSLIVTPLYCVQTMVLTCDTGLVAGMAHNYTQPSCSSQCGCAAPFSEFNPLCVSDTMTTYMSPCHAGCKGQDVIGGLTVYRGCACAPGSSAQRATVGACNAVQCRSEFMLHKSINACISILIVIALQAQLVTVMRSVRRLDRPIAIGLVTSVTLFFTFSCGHLVYTVIRVSTCAWFEGDRCLFHTPAFLRAIGGTSTGLSAVSAIITFVTWLVLRRRANSTEENIELTRRSSTSQDF